MSRKSESSRKSFVVEIDEEGFTNKRCRNCKGRLSVEEVQVFVGKVDEGQYLCLNCYANIVEVRSKKRRNSIGKSEAQAGKAGNFSSNQADVQGLTEEKNKSRSSYRTASVKESRVSGRSRREPKVLADYQYHRKKTDVTLFANATFNAGVFLNAVPGQSI